MNDKVNDRLRDWYPKGAPDASDAAAWYGALSETPAAPGTEYSVPGGALPPTGRKETKKRRVTKAIALTACFLAVACAAVISAAKVIAQLQGGAAAEVAPPAAVLPDDREGESYEDFREYFANYYTGTDDVEIPRAAVGENVTLPLLPQTGEDLSLQEIYAKVSPAVAGIIALRDGEEYSWGTGVVFTPDGYIITNTHIVSGCNGGRVVFPDGTEYEALLVGADRASDIAVLKIDGHDLPWAEFGTSDTLQVGDEAIAIGNPLGEEYAGTMTNGIISAINRNVSNNGHAMTLLQTNAALNEGNSGGPLVNSHGQVVGITNMKIMGVYTSTVEGIGFAIPSSVVKEIADQLLESGDVRGKPAIGITAAPVSQEAMSLYDLPAGVYVASVSDGSDAKEQGLVVGDIILQVNGEDVRTVAEVNAIKEGLSVGDPLTLTIYREGETIQVVIRLVDQADIK